MVALLGVTLGPQADTLIRRSEKLEMSRAVVLDACASAWLKRGGGLSAGSGGGFGAARRGAVQPEDTATCRWKSRDGCSHCSMPPGGSV